MKNFTHALVIFILLMLGLTSSASASLSIKNSIFQIISSENGSSTAFLTEKGLVTTLHSVLPDTKISKFSQIQVGIGKLDCAEKVNLIKVIPKMDLALLSAPKICKAQPLKTSIYRPSNRKLMLYGHPLSISEILDSEVRVRNIGLKPISVYLHHPNRRGPNKNTKVISLDEHMLPGHSGAPLLSGSQVVAIANGGRHGTPVSWAIPWPNEAQWVGESKLAVREINRLVVLPKGIELYQSGMSNDMEVITIEFTDGRLMSVPIQDNTKIDLGEQRGHPSLIKKGYSNQVIEYNLSIKQKTNNRRFASGAKKEFTFIRNGRNLLLEIKPPVIFTDSNYIYDHENKLMWTKKIVSMPWSKVSNYIKTVNLNKTLKYNDWRLPSKGNLIDLNTIVKSNPQLINNTSDWYWSSNKSPFLGRAIVVNGGTVSGTNKLVQNRDIDRNESVRLVRDFR